MEDQRAVRFRDPGSYVYSLASRPIDVVCPTCAGHAVVTRSGADPASAWRGTAKLVCTACSGAATKEFDRTYWGAAVDPYFGRPLWLQADLSGAGTRRVLWAFNREHLDRLAQYVGAQLRERPDGPGGLTYLARLPVWVKSAKHRPLILRALSRMRTTLAERDRGGFAHAGHEGMVSPSGHCRACGPRWPTDAFRKRGGGNGRRRVHRGLGGSRAAVRR